MFSVPEKRSNFFSSTTKPNTPTSWSVTQTSRPKYISLETDVEPVAKELSPGIKIIEGNGVALAGMGNPTNPTNPTENLKKAIMDEMNDQQCNLTRNRFGRVMTTKFMPLFINRLKRVGIQPTSQFGGRMKSAFSRQIKRCFPSPTSNRPRVSAGGAAAAIIGSIASAIPTLLPIAEKAAVTIWNFFKKLFKKKKPRSGQGLRLAGQGTPMRRGMPTKIVRLLASDVKKFIKAMLQRKLETMSGRGVGSLLKTAFTKVVKFIKKIFKKGKKALPQIKKVIRAVKPLLPAPVQKKISRVTKKIKTIKKKIAPPTKQLFDLARAHQGL